MRHIIKARDYYKEKAKLYANSIDKEGITLQETYTKYLQTIKAQQKGKATTKQVKQAKKQVETFTPEIIKFVHVKRFLEPVGRLIHNQNNSSSNEYESFDLENLKEKLLDETSTNKLLHNTPELTTIDIKTAIEIIDADEKKSKRRKLISDIMQALALLAIGMGTATTIFIIIKMARGI